MHGSVPITLDSKILGIRAKVLIDVELLYFFNIFIIDVSAQLAFWEGDWCEFEGAVGGAVCRIWYNTYF